MTRAAVVIGVAKTGNLPHLKATEAEATEIASWLTNEGYDVELVTDEDGSKEVTVDDVARAIAKFVTEDITMEFLLVYFTGHGVFFNGSDHWLLSKAPVGGAKGTAQETINLVGELDLAQMSGIANVIFVSDCCRMPNRDVKENRALNGRTTFPYHPQFKHQLTKVDRVSCEVGQAAFEIELVEDDGKIRSVSAITEALRRVFKTPREDSLAELEVDGETVNVVPNYRLEDEIRRKIGEVLMQSNNAAGLIQRTDIEVLSHKDDVYVATVPDLAGAAELPAAAPTFVQDAPSFLLKAEEAMRAVDPDLAADMFHNSETDTAILNSHTPDIELRRGFESYCGFVIPSLPVERVTWFGPDMGSGESTEIDPDPTYYDGTGVQFFRDEHSGVPVVRVWPKGPTSVGIKFNDGRATVLPALPGFVGHVAIDEIGITGVSWVPSEHDEQFQFYEQQQHELDTLRAMAAMAIQGNRFRVRDEEHGWQLADRIRMGKGLDPALGLYSAYAYAQAGLIDQVVDVHRFMTMQGTPIFDVGMLASRAEFIAYEDLAPVCPVLTQGWNRLRSREAPHADLLAEFQPFLLDSLITTFAAEGADDMLDALRDGAFA